VGKRSKNLLAKKRTTGCTGKEGWKLADAANLKTPRWCAKGKRKLDGEGRKDRSGPQGRQKKRNKKKT